MNIRTAVLAFTALSLTSMSMSAGVITLNFGENGSGDLGNSSTFAASPAGPALTLSGFSSNNTPVQLFGKNDGGDEVGVGLNLGSPDRSHEIMGTGFIQVNVSPLLTGYTNLIFQMGSTTGGESWAVYGANTAATLSGATLLSSGSDELSHSITTNQPYLDFKASSGDVLLTKMTATTNTPEPGSLGLLGAGLGLIAAGATRIRKQS